MAADPQHLELGAPDAAAAIAFYSALFGWETRQMNGGGWVDAGSASIGIHGGDDGAHFEPFFTVTDLDASAARLVELGGALTSEVNDSGEFGRWVECRDDQGVRFGLRQKP
jgi:predicted enzyme related to lactoylglutathione lyase